MGKAFGPFPTLIRIHMREPVGVGALHNKGWATDLWQQLHLSLSEFRAVCLIPPPKRVHSLFGVMLTHGTGKLISGVHTVHPTTNSVHCPPRMEMITLNEYLCASDPQEEHSYLPSHPEMDPLRHILDITLPTLHEMVSGMGRPPPPPASLPHLRTGPLPDSPPPPRRLCNPHPSSSPVRTSHAHQFC